MTVQTFEDITLPETKLYRVRGVGATYLRPQKAVGADGKPTVVYVAGLAAGGEHVELIAPEAERLVLLGAVVEAEAPKGYDELSRPELEILATQRGVTVRSTSADPQNPLDDDYRNALALFDLGSDSATLMAASSVPGGVVTTDSNQVVSPVLVDGVHPAPPTEQGKDVETGAVDEPQFAAARRATAGASGGFDARGKSPTEVSKWIETERPNTSATIAAAGDDPEAAKTVLDAERAAHQGDPRSTVVSALKPIADRK